MTAITRKRRKSHADMEEVFALEQRITDLEQKLRQMEDEVRTRRVVVVEEDGFERVVIRSRDNTTFTPGLSVFARTELSESESHHSCVSIYGIDSVGEDRDYASLGITLWGEGNGCASFDAHKSPKGEWSGEVYIDSDTPNKQLIVDVEGVHTRRR